jgi:hypothetical protein
MLETYTAKEAPLGSLHSAAQAHFVATLNEVLDELLASSKGEAETGTLESLISKHHPNGLISQQ